MSDPTPTTSTDAPGAILLAAGKGSRMRSDLPKVVHPVGGRPMICAVVDACRSAGCGRIIVVVGHGREHVIEAIRSMGPDAERVVEFAIQDEQHGTGHAVQCAAAVFGDADRARDVFVLAGDGPLIHPETLELLLERHRSTGAGATMASSVIEDPTGYGRIVRGPDGAFSAIVEQKDLADEQLAIREVNPSYYCFKAGLMFEALGRVNKSSSGEYYLTDVPGLLLGEGHVVEVIDAVPPEDVLSINTPEQLAEVDRIFRSREGVRG